MARVILVSDNSAAAAARVLDGLDAAIDEGLESMQGDAQGRSRVRTGEMRAGWHTEREGRTSGYLESGPEHTIYNELGTRTMSAQPMATPAADAEERQLPARVERHVRARTK